MGIDVNPLLIEAGLPRFDLMDAACITPAIDALLLRCEAALREVVRPGAAPDDDTLAAMMDPPLQALDFAWSTVQHLQGVCDTSALRAAIAANQPKVTAFQARLSSDARLHGIYKEIAARQGDVMEPTRRRVMDNVLRGFRHAGAELPAPEKERFVATLQRSAALGREFSEHLQDATDSFVHWASEAELTGVPAAVRESLAAAAAADGHPGRFKVTLQQPCLVPLMQYARSRALREMLYRANVTRASEFGPAAFDNGPVIRAILALRHERAALLGYPHHAALSLVPKMADSPDQVLEFLRDLARRCRRQAEAELAALRRFACDRLGMDELQVWDIGYASEQLRQERYAFSEVEVMRHFRLDQVLDGLFRIAESLFGITIRGEAAPGWHPDVTAYRIERGGELAGRFYLDPYARAGKRGGAWMKGASPRWLRPDGRLQTAVAYLVTNFAAPAGAGPALLRHGDVVTLFHEFGHALHFLLSRVDVLGASGISGVEWDAIELPSQLMENFAWQWPVLQRIGAHVDTGAPLPRALFDRMTAARTFQSGMGLLRQVEFALLDMRLHAEPGREAAVQKVHDEVRAEVSLLAGPAYSRFQNGFSHVFAGGYAAGYYSYLWAEVLSADAWGVFERAGVLNTATGARYRAAILERGGSRPMRDNFIEFVGRPPTIDALLRQRGVE